MSSDIRRSDSSKQHPAQLVQPNPSGGLLVTKEHAVLIKAAHGFPLQVLPQAGINGGEGGGGDAVIQHSEHVPGHAVSKNGQLPPYSCQSEHESPLHILSQEEGGGGEGGEYGREQMYS